jgi:hypothetical protein
MNNPFFAMKEGDGILLLLLLTYPQWIHTPIILCPNSQKFQNTFFPLILQSFE